MEGRGCRPPLCRLLADYERPSGGGVLVDGALLPKRGICSVRLVFQHLEKAVDPRMRTERTLEGAGDAPKWMFGDLGIRREWLCRYRTSCRGGASYSASA